MTSQCTTCHKAASFKCSKCPVPIQYCSEQCQRVHWNVWHRRVCGQVKRGRESDKCHNPVDLITQEDVPEFHFDVMVGEKKYCFDIEALAHWISSAGAFPLHELRRYGEEDSKDAKRPINPATGLPFSVDDLLRFADVYDDFLKRFPGKRLVVEPEKPDVAFTIQVYNELVDGGDDEWRMVGDRSGMWNGMTAEFTREDVQYVGLERLLYYVGHVELVDENGDEVIVDGIFASLTIGNDEGEPVYQGGFSVYVNDFAEYLVSVLADLGMDPVEFERQLSNGTIKHSTLSIGYVTAPLPVYTLVIDQQEYNVEKQPGESVYDAFRRVFAASFPKDDNPWTILTWEIDGLRGLQWITRGYAFAFPEDYVDEDNDVVVRIESAYEPPKITVSAKFQDGSVPLSTISLDATRIWESFATDGSDWKSAHAFPGMWFDKKTGAPANMSNYRHSIANNVGWPRKSGPVTEDPIHWIYNQFRARKDTLSSLADQNVQFEIIVEKIK